MQPNVSVAVIPVTSPDGTFSIGRDSFPEFETLQRHGVHVQSDRVRVAHPDPGYVETALAVLTEACQELGVPEAQVALVDTVIAPPRLGLRYGFKGAYTTDYPNMIWVFANWTTLAELRAVVRHELAHLAFARTHTAEESAGHTGPSEEFALAFEAGRFADDDAMSEDDLPASEAARAKRRDRDMAAEQKALLRPGMAKVFRQVTDAAAKPPTHKRQKAKRPKSK